MPIAYCEAIAQNASSRRVLTNKWADYSTPHYGTGTSTVPVPVPMDSCTRARGTGTVMRSTVVSPLVGQHSPTVDAFCAIASQYAIGIL